METIQDIIDNIYELEGLMREIYFRADDAPSDLYECARAKASLIFSQVSVLNTSTEHEVAPIPEPDTIIEHEPTMVHVPDIEVKPFVETEVTQEPELDPELEIEPEPEPIQDDVMPDEVEVPVREVYRAPLRSMFTINDMFKFRRELFGNSEADFNEVLGLVSGMTSYNDAEGYFYGYLCWPADNETVAEFMSIIKRYFN